MSYCRFIEGDVYMYASVYGGIECCACRLAEKVNTIFSPGTNLAEDDPRREWVEGNICDCDDACDKCTMHGNLKFKTHEEALAHLEEHKAAGHKVPTRAFKALKRDIEENHQLDPCYCECGEVACVFDFENDTAKCVKCSFDEKRKE